MRFVGCACRRWVQLSRKAFVKPEFEVAKRMVGLLYFQVQGDGGALEVTLLGGHTLSPHTYTMIRTYTY